MKHIRSKRLRASRTLPHQLLHVSCESATSVDLNVLAWYVFSMCILGLHHMLALIFWW